MNEVNPSAYFNVMEISIKGGAVIAYKDVYSSMLVQRLSGAINVMQMARAEVFGYIVPNYPIL